MIIEGELSMARRLEFNDVYSDAESVGPIIPAQQCTTPHASISIPFCGSSYTPQCDDTMKPKIGMTFADVESAKEFYKCYAHHVGFSVRTGQHKVVDGVIAYKRFYCAKEGFRDEKNVEEPSCKRRKYEKTITRCGCEAMLVIKRTKDHNYIVIRFEEDHTHAFVTPKKKQFIRSNRKVTLSAKKTLLTCHKASIGTSQAYRYLRVGAGGFENVGFLKRDLQNYHGSLRVLINSSDAQMFVDQLSRKSLANPGFYFDYVVDDQGRLVHVFWADATCRKNYAHFGDLVSFDSTYSTNEYGMIFTPFTGVNHHKNSVLFGAAMLLNEKTESYVWLFHTFLKAMGGVSPKLIITDEAASIKLAIQEVFTTPVHRLCMWHILMKVVDKVGPTLKEDEEFHQRLNCCVWSSETPTKFEERWGHIMTKYNLHGNEWFTTKFEQRKSWVPAYFNDIPLSGLLRTTSRSESANSFFSRLIGWKLSLVEFWLRFDGALEEQWYKKLKEVQLVPTKEGSQVEEFESYLGCSIPNQIDIHPPSDTRSRGKIKRIKGHHDKGSQQNKSEKKKKNQRMPRMCKKCKQLVKHDSRNCPNKEPQQ